MNAVDAIFRYNPMTDDEQEVVDRLVGDEALYVEVEGWGFHSNPTITFGDKRIQVSFFWEFNRPQFTIPVYALTLALKMRDGTLLYRDTLDVTQDHQPIGVSAGLQIQLIWDISVGSINPELINRVRPGLKGKVVSTL